MNRSYRIIWNQARQAWVVASELVKGKGKSKSQSTASASTTITTAVLAASLGLTVIPAVADDWNVSSGEWSTDSNWLDGTAPGNTDYAYIDNSGTAQVTTPGVTAYVVYVGRNNTGTLSISGNGDFQSSKLYVAQSTGTNGTVTVTDSNAQLTVSFNFEVGSAGTGLLTISNGGTLITNNSAVAKISSGSNSHGTVTVDGAGSSWINASSVSVGQSSTGVLNIINGGSVNNTGGYIGYNATGTATVDGGGSSWTNSGSLDIGYYGTGTGTLTISNGGNASNTSSTIGNKSGSVGNVTVDGSGSSWTNSNTTIVGYFGAGTLGIANGGSVNTTSFGQMGRETGSTGTATVDGSGSSWTIGGDLYLGQSGAGTLTISDSATVDISGITRIALYAGSTGNLNIGSAYGEQAVAAGNLSTTTITFGSGTGALVFNHTNTDYTFSSDITSSGAVGLYSGSTRFTGDLSNFNGTMTVDGGTLSVASGDTLTLGGDYTQTGSGTLKVDVADNTTYGKLVVSGTATLPTNAKIDVNVSDPNFNFTATDMQDIIGAGSLLSDGTFSVTDNSILFDFDAVKDGNTVDLTLAVASSGSDSNSSDSTGIIETAANNTGNSPVAPAAKVLDQLSAVYVNNSLTTGDDDMDALIEAIGGITNETELADAVAQTMPILVSGTTQVATGTIHSTNRVVQARQQSFTGYSSGDGFLTDRHFWVKPVGNWAEQDQRNGVSGYKADSYGLVGGIDGDINDNTKLGFAVSYMNTDVKGKGTASHNTADIDVYQAIVYGSHSLNSNLELNWQADVGINKNEGTRQIVIGNLSRVANADYDSYTAHVGAGIGKSFELNDKTTIIPSIRADYARIKDDSYAETGSAGGMGLNVSGATSDEFILTAKGSLSHDLNDQVTLVANAGIGYDLINDQTSLTASYIGGGVAFTTKGIDPSPWIGSAGAGINYNISETSEITARYDVEGRSDFLSQTASVKFRWLF